MRMLAVLALSAGIGASLTSAVDAVQDVSRANRHGLIIGVGSYQDSRISALRGVVHDIANARQMAGAMGVPPSNLIVLQDQEANSKRIRHELRALAGRVRDGDRVFLYFSGHGARYASTAASTSCQEALVPWDADVSRPDSLLDHEEIAAALAPAYAKTDKVFVFIDACHSGGVRTTKRDVDESQKPGELVPKFTVLGSNSQCRQASNVRTRSVLDGARSEGAPGRNVVQFSSSRPDEVSLDSPEMGGLATSSWRYCALYAEDRDGSGNLSVQEIADCVQRRIDQRLAGHPRFTGQTVQVSGNTGFSPFLPVPTGEVARSSPQRATTVQQLALPATRLPFATGGAAAEPPERNSSTSAAPAANNLPEPLFPLASVVAQSDERHVVDVTYPKTPLRIGHDYFDLTVASNRGGYVYLILQSSDQQNTYILFPNTLDRDNRLRPGEKLRLPRPSWRLRSEGPHGRNRLLVMVTDAPRDLTALRTSPTGPFVKTLSDISAARSLAWLVGSAVSSSEPTCSGQLQSKDLVYVQKCSDSFGAKLIEFDEQ